MLNIIFRKSVSVALNLLTLGGLLLGGAGTVTGVYSGIVGLRYFGVGLLALVVLVTLLRLLGKTARRTPSG